MENQELETNTKHKNETKEKIPLKERPMFKPLVFMIAFIVLAGAILGGMIGCWSANVGRSFEVSFVSGLSNVENPESIIYMQGIELNRLPIPVDPDDLMKFDCWCDDAELTTPTTDRKRTYEPTVLYGKWYTFAEYKELAKNNMITKYSIVYDSYSDRYRSEQFNNFITKFDLIVKTFMESYESKTTVSGLDTAISELVTAIDTIANDQ